MVKKETEISSLFVPVEEHNDFLKRSRLYIGDVQISVAGTLGNLYRKEAFLHIRFRLHQSKSRLKSSA